MKKRNLTVRIGGLEDMAKDFIKAWHQVDAGNSQKNAPIEKITFENEQQLFKSLTPRRCDLLRYVHEHGKITIRSLAKKLNRDYSNVHQDVKALHQVGLILQDKNNQYYMPWEKIITEIPMTILPAKKTNKPKAQHPSPVASHMGHH